MFAWIQGNAETKKKKVPLAGKKGADGKWPCSGGNNIQCCVDKKGGDDSGDDPKCTVGSEHGVCLPTAKCTKTSVPGSEGPDGKWPCSGGDDIQCCIDKKGGDDSSDKPLKCTVGGVNGVCLPKAKCKKQLMPGTNGLDVMLTCFGGKDMQCCVDS